MAQVPISTHALSWAVEESGMPVSDLEKRLKVSDGTVDRWMIGEDQPNTTQFNRLKSLLKRPAAVFFMNSPPESTESAVAMRFALGATSRARSPEERQAIRDSSRVRKFVGSLQEDLGRGFVDILTASTNENPEDIANRFRSDYLQISIDEQLSWPSPTQAFKHWRSLIERLGILVFLYPLGEHSARGFALASELPPVIGVSTSWHASVRVYTLFHELGHVLTRTSSSCVEDSAKSPTNDQIERWCETFAASFLMPRQAVQKFIGQRASIDPIANATWIANKLSVSRKSALLRLVEIGAAQWADFRILQSQFERKSGGGRPDPDRPRTRDIVRQETYGSCLSVVRDAHVAGLVSEADIRTYLRVQPDELM